MTEPALVLRKLMLLREHVARARRRRPPDLATWRGDVDRQDALGMSVFVALQEAIDIAFHIAAEEGFGVPASNAEAFELLGRRGVISSELAVWMSNGAALRNRIAHGYASIDADRLWAELPGGLDALERYAASVAAFLGPPAR